MASSFIKKKNPNGNDQSVGGGACSWWTKERLERNGNDQSESHVTPPLTSLTEEGPCHVDSWKLGKKKLGKNRVKGLDGRERKSQWRVGLRGSPRGSLGRPVRTWTLHTHTHTHTHLHTPTHPDTHTHTDVQPQVTATGRPRPDGKRNRRGGGWWWTTMYGGANGRSRKKWREHKIKCV